MATTDDKFAGGCMGLVLGFVVVGLVGIGLGLIFLPFLKALGLGILSAVVGGIGFAIYGYRST